MKSLKFLFLLFFFFLWKFETKAQVTFDDLVQSTTIYDLPLDLQSLENPSNKLSLELYNSLFFNFGTNTFIRGVNGDKRRAWKGAKIEDKFFQYGDGQYFENKVYLLGQVQLNNNFITLLLRVINIDISRTYIYSFNSIGEVLSTVLLTSEDSFVPTLGGRYLEYSFITIDKDIFYRSYSESQKISYTIRLADDGIFEITSESIDNYFYENDGWFANKEAELNQFAADGVPLIKQ